MEIESFEIEPIAEIPFLNAGKGMGNFRKENLPIHYGTIKGLPKKIEGIIATADLQSRETFQSSNGARPRLMGEVIPKQLAEMVLQLGKDPNRFVVLLAGDFYTVPALDRRGGSGDVSRVWRAFAEHFGWVVGVAGNHDTFDSCCDKDGIPRFHNRIQFLNDETTEFANMRIGGVNGIIGNPRRIWRTEQKKYCEKYLDVAGNSPDVIVMHDGPDDPGNNQKGCPELRQLIHETRRCLIVRGHAHWNVPFVQYASGHQILNVDSRVAVLTGV